MSKTSGLRQFLMLLYKGLLLRKRHYVITVFEIIVPIIIASVPVIIVAEFAKNNMYMKSQQGQMENATIYEPTNPFRFGRIIGDSGTVEFVYTPDNDIAAILIDDAIEMWKNNSGYTRKTKKNALTTEEFLDSYVMFAQRSSDNIIVATIFNNFDSTGKQLPDSLDYKIRYGNKYGSSFFTNMKYRIDGPQKKFEYADTYFLSWQAAVEESFIQRMLVQKGKTFDFQVMMQRFPYPEHEDSAQSYTLVNIAAWVIVYGFLIFVINLVKRVTEEKANGSKELLKMMGMTDCLYWLSTFMNYFVFGAIIMLIISILYKVPFRESAALLRETHFTLLLVLLLLFMLNLVLFCLAISTFFPKPVFATIVMAILYMVSFSLLSTNYFLPNSQIAYFSIPLVAKLSICLLPAGSLLTMFAIISTCESIGEGARWSNISSYDAFPDMNMLMVMGMMVLSAFIYGVITWYIDAVWPWQNGVPKPFYFPFSKTYWCGHQTHSIADDPQIKHSSEFFETEPIGSTPGVVIQNLSKVFRTGFQTKLAVNDLSLNIYNGQITALLGHNGAGKTTTINILTGLFPPTSGSASINGWDIGTHTKKARRSLGVCPQQNVLYDTLTVDEHLKFYAGLKGVEWKNLANESDKILKILKLEDKKNELAKTLSGGMKRKLSLGIAIIGDSKVLFLDEPTSGMDPEARRSVWDALIEIRQNCTIVLTTHYMEEADILGDRIAIMADGEVQCCGSPMFLKRKFGTGYHLHVVKDIYFDLTAVEGMLKNHVPELVLVNDLEKEVTFNLSSNTSTSFGKMFEALETNKSKLGVSSCGISITTMDDVFLNVANIAELKHKRDQNEGIPEDEQTVELEDVFKQQQQLPESSMFTLNQLFGLLVKRLQYSKRHWSIFIAQIVVPFAVMCLCLSTIQKASITGMGDSPPLKLDLTGVYGDTKGFYQAFGDQDAKSFAEEDLKKVLEENHISLAKPEDPQKYVLEFGKTDLPGYLKTLLVGGTVKSNSSDSNKLLLTAWYNGEPFHTMPMALNIMHNAILRKVLGTSGKTISVTNYPIMNTRDFAIHDTYRFLERLLACIFVPLALSFLSASYVLVPIQENTSKAKLLQLMTGLSSVLYWSAMFMWDLVIHVVVCTLLLIPFAIFNSHVFFTHADAIGTVYLLLLLYGWCSIPLSYLMSFMFQKPYTGFQVMTIICIITGIAFSSVVVAVTMAFRGNPPTELSTAAWFLRILPGFSVSIGFANLFGIAFNNAYCDGIAKSVLKIACNASIPYKDNPLLKCCKGICGSKCLNETYPITWDDDGCAREIFFMAVDGILFFLMLLFLETTISKSFWRLIKLHVKAAISKIRPQTMELLQNDPFQEDSEVILEEQRVEDMCSRGASDEALMVMGLTKIYKTLPAVDHLTFGVHQKECFGLLGVNGAGKTTTFKMLTGDILPHEGNAFIQGSSLIQNRKKFQSYIGYCPQYDALIDRLTGREMLILFGRLRGLSGKEMELAVDQLIRMVDLQQHADKQSMLYSGGNKRKLSLGLALIGTPPLVLLDEPTCGVDPVSRRKIWNILSQARNNTGAAVILTTHSMEESEALCGRLAIMVNGKFRCLGSIQQLKSKYGKGYTVILKMKKEELQKPEALQATKTYFETNVPGANLKDDHQGMLQYHVTDPSMTLSHLFNFMDDMKPNFNLEDYLVSDTSLEQIFLAFARAQRESKEYV